MDIKASLTEYFVPSFNGNEELPAEQQIRIQVKFPTVMEAEELYHVRMIDRESGERESFFDTEKILKNHVRHIVNLRVQDVGSEAMRDIDTGRALAEAKNPQLKALISEIQAYIALGFQVSGAKAKNS